MIKGVAARKAEKARLKQVKELMKSYAPIPHELMVPIRDVETEWKATNPTWIAEEAKKAMKKNRGTGVIATINVEDENQHEDEDADIIINVDEINHGYNMTFFLLKMRMMMLGLGLEIGEIDWRITGLMMMTFNVY